MDFSKALELIKNGNKVTRAGWNGSKYGGLTMYVTAQFPDSGSKNTQPYLYMIVNDIRTPWFPSNGDIFANDWLVI